MPLCSTTEWEAFTARFPGAHLLQSAAWGELKAGFGWQPVRIVAGGSGAQVLFRRLPLGLSVAYLPKGPLGEDWRALLPELDALCLARGAIFLKIEPDAQDAEFVSLQARLPGFQPSRPVQPQRTIMLSLRGGEEDWLARMKQKTRYNIRLAERKGVVVRESTDLDAFMRLMQVTGSRDDFGVHSPAYYRRAYERFAPDGACALLSAEYEGQPLAMLMVFAQGRRAWYLYGASSDEERNRMPTYPLQWQAMRWAAARGCQEYDLWGVPDAPPEQLEAEFETRSDGLWGVYRFKRGFGGEIVRAAGAWDRIYRPLLYRAYTWYAGRRGGEGAG